MRAYFNYAGLARTPPKIKSRIHDADQTFEATLFSEEGVARYFHLLSECRKNAARLLRSPAASEISLLPNASAGLNLAFQLLSPSLGKQIIVTSDQEHPAVEIPLEFLARSGIRVERVSAESADEYIHKIRKLVELEAVGLVILSHVSYKDGRILPILEISKIAAESRIPFVVDGSQAVGQIDVAINEIHPLIYVFSGHKWIFGPMGTGAMWSSPQIKEIADRFSGGWFSWALKSDGINGGRFESGTINFGLVAGLSLAFQDALEQGGRSLILKKIGEAIREPLSDLPQLQRNCWRGERAPGIVTLQLPDQLPSWELADRLLKHHGVVVKPFRPPERPNAVRISYAPWTEPAEVDLLVRAVRQELG